jgi:uncharacterized protein
MLFRILVLIFAIVSFSPVHAQEAAVARLMPQLEPLTRAETFRAIRYAESSILYEILAPIRRGRVKDLENLEKYLPGFLNRAAFCYRALALLMEKHGFSNVASLYRARADIYSDRAQGKIDFSELTKREAESERNVVGALTLEMASLEKDMPPSESKKKMLLGLGDTLGQNILLAATNEFGSLQAGQTTQPKTALIGYGRILRSDNLNVFFLLGAFASTEQCESAKKTFADDFLASAKAKKLTAKVETSVCEARVPSGTEYEALRSGAPAKHYVLFTDNMTLMFAHGSGSLDDERVACEKILGSVQQTKPNANCYRPTSATAQSTTNQLAPAQSAATQPAVMHEAIVKAASQLSGLGRSEILRGVRGAEKEVKTDLEMTVADARFLADNEKDMAALYKRAAYCYRALAFLAKDFPDIAALYRARAQLHDDALAKKISAAQLATGEKQNDAAKESAVTSELAALDKKAPPKESTLRSLERLGNAVGQIVLAAVHSEQGDVPYVHTFNQGMIALSKDDYPNVAKLLRPLAERGDPRAQFWIGYMYQEGKGGLTRDLAEALKWLQRSADQGERFAQYRLGSAYASGAGVARDFTSAYVWLSLAASQGDEDATKARDQIATKMTPDQVTLAKKRASEWKPKAPAAAVINPN